MNLPEEVLWIIWTYAGPKAYFMDTELFTIIQQKRQQFALKPLRIHYQLCRWKKRHFYGDGGSVTIGRPSMYVEAKKYIDISGNQSLGKVDENNNIHLSKNLAGSIIPVSTMKESTNGFHLTVLYWTTHYIWTEDNRAKLYSILWPSWNLALHETS